MLNVCGHEPVQAPVLQRSLPFNICQNFYQTHLACSIIRGGKKRFLAVKNKELSEIFRKAPMQPTLCCETHASIGNIQYIYQGKIWIFLTTDFQFLSLLNTKKKGNITFTKCNFAKLQELRYQQQNPQWVTLKGMYILLVNEDGMSSRINTRQSNAINHPLNGRLKSPRDFCLYYADKLISGDLLLLCWT